MTIAFPALGTTAVVAVSDPKRLHRAHAVLVGELEACDAACSRFRDDSDLARVCTAAGRPVRVGRYLVDALQVALRAAEQTGGLVDPTVGRSLRQAGYDRTFAVVQARDGLAFRARFAPAGGWRSVEVDPNRSSVRVPAGVELDLGATAKAFAADRATESAAAACGCGVLVALGGDVAVAGPAPPAGWPIGVADDHAGEPAATVSIATGGLATSSTCVRRWRSGDSDLHHILDPRTGRPADSCWRSATVAAATCVDANVAATAAILLAGDAPAWLAARNLPARLVARGGEVETVADWPVAA